MHDQVEERLKFYETGEAPRKNIDVMKEVMAVLGDAMDVDAPAKESKKVRWRGYRGLIMPVVAWCSAQPMVDVARVKLCLRAQ
jgi:hypothetical protein